MNNTLNYLVNKYNIDLNQKSPIEIPNVGRLDLLRWICELEFMVGAEIGVDEGNFSRLICNTNPLLTLYAVDPWLKHDEYHEYKNQEHLDNIYNSFRTRMKNEIDDGHCVIIRKKSMDALADFKDESLDFVYIDANHEGEFPYQDISGWTKKVRKGGIIAGHDFIRPRFLTFTVKDAVERYTKENNIQPLFVLGSYSRKPGQIRDRARSWMFVKS